MIRTLTVPADAVRELHGQVASNRIRTCFLWSGGSLIYRYEKEPNAAAELHKVNSVTKSILSLLVGIADDEGRIGPLDAPISSYLPRVPEDKAAITVEHLLTMSPGFDWPEMGAWHGYPKAMVNSPDWIRFVLGREMTEEPGRKMIYNSGASQLLSAVLQRAVGMPTAAYARKRLFEPLGIDRFLWPSDPHGIGIGGFGLHLRGEDLVRIGRLVLRKGIWEGRRIVSERWIEESTRTRFHTYDRFGSYGYHWWTLGGGEDDRTRPFCFFAMGFGGQFILVVPAADLVATFTSELFKKTAVPLRIFKETIWNRLE